MRKYLFLLSFLCSIIGKAQLVVEHDGGVKLHAEIPENYYTENEGVAYFGGSIIVDGIVYHDIATGINSSIGNRQLSESTDACSLLSSLLEQRNDSLSILNILSPQRMKALFPKSVLIHKDKQISVDYMALVPLLVAAIKELQDEVTTLKEYVARTTNQNNKK